LFSRDGGSPVWVPAFAVKHATFNTTAAKAGVQLVRWQ
jgi:hypothetical protein